MRVGVLISGFGSNMMKLIESCENNDSKASIELVFSNNPNAKGIEYAKSKGIRVISIDHKNYENRNEFDDQVNKVLLDHDIELICNAGFMRIHSDNFVKKWFNRHLNEIFEFSPSNVLPRPNTWWGRPPPFDIDTRSARAPPHNKPGHTNT